MIDELQKNAHQKDYAHVQGLLPLRQAIARFYEKYTKYPIDAE
jgi:aspartate/methionine/tyrosine aminotransferase